jgi:capsular polysaccharide biosynthesis protein
VDLGEILRVMRSRWYIVLPMVLLAIGLGAGVYVKVPTTYTTYTMVSLLSSQSDTKSATQGLDNPFLNFNDSLVATADFLGRRLESTDIELQLRQAGVTEKYTVSLPENAQGPFLTITLTGTDKDHMLTSAATLAQFADTTLVKIQEQNAVSSRDQIRLTQVIPPQKPAAALKKKLELVIVAVGGTIALTFVLTFIVESVSRRRRSGGEPEASDASPVWQSGSAPFTRASASVSGRGSNGQGSNGPGSNGQGLNGPGLNGPVPSRSSSFRGGSTFSSSTHGGSGLNGGGINGGGLNGSAKSGGALSGVGVNGSGANGSGANGAGANGAGANGFGGKGGKGGKPDVGDETRVINGPASPASKAAPQPPEKKPADNDAPPDRTAIITTSMPLRGDRLPQRPDVPVVSQRPEVPVVSQRPEVPVVPQRPDVPVVPRQPSAPAADKNPPQGKAGVPQPSGANPAPGKPAAPPAAGKRVGSSTTYQSQSAERRGQDADRVNGS